MQKLNKTIHDNEPIEKPILIHTSGKVTASFAVEKAKRIAQLEDEVYKLTAALPDKVTLRPSLYFTRKMEGAYLHFVKSSLIINEKHIQIFFSYSKQKQDVFGKESGIDTHFQIKLGIFSDNRLEGAFKQFLASHPNERYFTNTEYLFDNNGSAIKAIWLPSAFTIQHEPLFDAKTYRIYLSEITEEDIDYVEQALLLLKIQLEVYTRS